MNWIKKLFKRTPPPFKFNGRKMILHLSDGLIEEYNVPSSWDEITVNQIIAIQSLGEDVPPLALFCILTGIPEKLAYMIDFDEINKASQSFSFLSDSKALADSFKDVPIDYQKKKIGKQPFLRIYECQLLSEEKTESAADELEVGKKITEKILGFEIGNLPYTEYKKTIDFFYKASLHFTRNGKELARQSKTQLQSKRVIKTILAGLSGCIIIFITLLITTYVCGMTYLFYRLIEYLCYF
jgi:hypothetical protein